MKRNQTVIFFTIFVVFFFIEKIYGQNFTLSGVVSDSVTNEKLFYSNVVVVTNDTLQKIISHATTDIQGYFELTNIPVGEYLIKTSYVGYEKYSNPISIKGTDKKIDIGNINLKANSTMLIAVEITAKKPVYSQEGEKTLYNVSEDPTIQSGTASDALQNAPGVEVDIEGNITLLGVSSVEIWLNGKPSRMNAEDLKNHIQMLPANTLQRIEVITNPSARYSAKGTGGIINIVTNDNIKKNSFYSFGVRASTRPAISPWFSYVWSNKKFDFSLYTHFNYNQKRSKNHGYGLFFNNVKDTVTHEIFSSESTDQNNGGGLYLGISYDIDTMNNISVWMGGSLGASKGDMFSEEYRREYVYSPATYRSKTENRYQYNYYSGYVNCSYEHLFKEDGHTFDGNIGGNFWGRDQSINYFRNFELQNYLNRNKKISDNYLNYNIDANVNYILPYIKNGEISVGVSGNRSIDNEVSKSDTIIWGTNYYSIDSLRFKDAKTQSNELDIYLTIQHQFNNFSIKGGLRAEYVHYNTNYYNVPKNDFSKNYFGLYPSLHLSYRTKSMHHFKLSYTRRVSNPDSYELSTFIEYDEDSYSTGNPDLLQTFTNSFEGGWRKYFNSFGNVGVNTYFRNSINEINGLTDIIYSDVFGRVVSYSMYINSGKSYRTGIDANVTYKLKTFMQIRFYGNLFYDNRETYYQPTNKIVVTENLRYSLRLNYWAKLWDILEVNVSTNYSSANTMLFSETKPNYSFNCGLRSDFLKRKISVYINATDIFNWNKTNTNIETPFYIAYDSYKPNSRFIGGGITFRFGKIELESKAEQVQQNMN